MTKIVFIVSTLKKSGPIVVLKNIIKYLDLNIYTPVIITLSEEPTESEKEYFETQLGAEVICLGLSRLKGIFSAKNKIKHILKAVKPDVIHSHGIRADYICSGLSEYSVRISTLHNYAFEDYKMKFGKIKSFIMIFIHYSLVKKNPSMFIACSKALHEKYKKNQQVSLKYIQNGVDLKEYYPIKSKQGIRNKLDIRKDSVVFISVGSLVKLKNLKTTVDAFTLFNNTIENSALLIIGDGPEKKYLDKSNKNIFFLGSIANVYEYLQASDIYVSSSLSEGLPNSVMEAMATGLPCVLSDISAHHELVSTDKSLIFAEQNASDACEKFLVALENKEHYSQNSYHNATKLFSAKKMSCNYQELYKRMV
jgi:glycosyltransferase involved in cell wall biosynthesis